MILLTIDVQVSSDLVDGKVMEAHVQVKQDNAVLMNDLYDATQKQNPTAIHPSPGMVDLASSWIDNIPIETLDSVVAICMVVGAVLPYIPQYLAIRKSRNSSGFSTLVCLTLLISNISRIVFWFGKPFLLTLAVQSVVMSITQILLLEVCVRTKRQNSGPLMIERTLLSNDCLTYFWKWTSIWSYLGFICIMTAVLAGLMYLFHEYTIFVECLGYISTLSDAMLAVPQLIKNFRRRSITGLSLAMVLMWLAGDVFKTVYFVLKFQPMQFLVCGSIQIVIDILILFQMCLYGIKPREEE